MTLDTDFSARTYEIRLPRWLVAIELDRLAGLSAEHQLVTASRKSPWIEQVECTIREIFSSPDGVLEEWQALNITSPDWGSSWDDIPAPSLLPKQWLLALRDNVNKLPLLLPRLPYWSERRRGEGIAKLDLLAVAQRIAGLAWELGEAGYFAWAFGEFCVDGDWDGILGNDPAAKMHRQLGRFGLWPIMEYGQYYSLDDLCDVIEFFADHVRRPIRSHLHSYNGCGWHYDDFDPDGGLRVYRWQVNEVLEQSSLGLTLASTGRLEHVAPSAVEELVDAVRQADNVHDADSVELEHALTLFRTRGASILDRRHAVIALAGILERRRPLVKQHLAQKDEGALFTIANEFGIRHQNPRQQTNYDQDLYLEWIFYWYVATINLTNRIVGRQSHAAQT